MVFIGKRSVVCVVAAALVFAFAGLGVFAVVNTVADSRTVLGAIVVIDAGHGGFDGGVVGVSGTKESDLNLRLALTLGGILEEDGVGVVYTRTADEALGSTKRQDMSARAEIIKNSRPDCVISLHLNSYPDKTRRGVQVFYDDTGKGVSFASFMQERLNATINEEYSKRSDLAPQAGDYFVTKCADCPSLIIECGFISNPEDEALLKTEAFRRRLCREIADAVIFAVS